MEDVRRASSCQYCTMSRPLYFNTRPVIRTAIVPIFAGLLLMACDASRDAIGPPPAAPPPNTPAPVTGVVTGTVTNSVNGKPIAGAIVHIRKDSVMTDAGGRFEFASVATGLTTLSCFADGFESVRTDITVPIGKVTQDIQLARLEVFFLSPWDVEYAMYVPAKVDTIRAVILAVGGPDTRGFATGTWRGGPIAPAVEASLHALGRDIRTLASTHELAVMGMSQTTFWDETAWDGVVGIIDLMGRLNRHPELATVPVLVYGMSSGGDWASGFAARNPQRVAGLFLKTPSKVSSATTRSALRVPTYLIEAERDTLVDNDALIAQFKRKRSAGALWALAREPGVSHDSLTAAERQLTSNWIRSVLDLRLPGTSSDPLRDIDETSGWLGNHVTAETAPWATYAGDRARASWFPSETTAREWASFVAPRAAAITVSGQKSPKR